MDCEPAVELNAPPLVTFFRGTARTRKAPLGWPRGDTPWRWSDQRPSFVQPHRTWCRWTGSQLKTWIATFNDDPEPFSGLRIFGCVWWRRIGWRFQACLHCSSVSCRHTSIRAIGHMHWWCRLESPRGVRQRKDKKKGLCSGSREPVGKKTVFGCAAWLRSSWNAPSRAYSFGLRRYFNLVLAAPYPLCLARAWHFSAFDKVSLNHNRPPYSQSLTQWPFAAN